MNLEDLDKQFNEDNMFPFYVLLMAIFLFTLGFVIKNLIKGL